MYQAVSKDVLYGFVNENTQADIYTLAKIQNNGDYARKNIDIIAPIPEYDNYVIANVYYAAEGLNFYNNYINVLYAKIETDISDLNNVFINGIPCIGRHYMTSENQIKYIIEQLEEKKAYIDYCLGLV